MTEYGQIVMIRPSLVVAKMIFYVRGLVIQFETAMSRQTA